MFAGLRAPSCAIALSLLFAACPPSPPSKDPIGQMPTASTTAEPQWIPWRPRAGQAVDADPREKHFSELRQLTFGGDNAEAYFSADGHKLILQSTRDGNACDQIYTLDLESGETKLVSTGK